MHRYLRAFVKTFGLEPLVRLNTKVVRALPWPPSAAEANGHASAASDALTAAAAGDGKVPAATSSGGSGGERWRLTTAPAAGGGGEEEHQFDALLVCNGHFSEPRLPPSPGEKEGPTTPHLHVGAEETILHILCCLS